MLVATLIIALFLAQEPPVTIERPGAMAVSMFFKMMKESYDGKQPYEASPPSIEDFLADYGLVRDSPEETALVRALVRYEVLEGRRTQLGAEIWRLQRAGEKPSRELMETFQSYGNSVETAGEAWGILASGVSDEVLARIQERLAPFYVLEDLADQIREQFERGFERGIQYAP